VKRQIPFQTGITVLLLAGLWLARPALADFGLCTHFVDKTGGVGKCTSIALDTSGKPHISYFNETNDDLKYAAFDGASWNIATVDSTGDVGEWTSIALDANDYPHISYYDNSNDDLKCAFYCRYELPGDMNDDCKVDFRDFAMIAVNWLIDCDQSPTDPACVPK